MRLTLDYALTRWSTLCAARRDIAAGYDVALMPFLAGWAMRDMGAVQPTMAQLGTFCDSFRAGWAEADTALSLLARDTAHPYTATRGGSCAVCGLAAHDRVHQ